MEQLEAILELLKPILETMAGQNGMLLQALTVMASARLVFKPLMSLLRGIVELTPTPKDNALLDKIMANKYYKVGSYLIDYFFSIKLPKK